MEAQTMIVAFHGAAARDLLIYMGFLGVACAGAVTAALVCGGRTLWSFALVIAVMGGALAVAAHNYRAGVPEKVAADVAAHAADPAGTAARFAATYGPAEAGARFARLALLWGVLIGLGLMAGLAVRWPVLRGAGLAVAALSAGTLALDLGAYLRDIRFAARW